MRLIPLKLLNGRGASSAPSSEAVTPGADLAAELKRHIQLLYVAHVSENGVDYRTMKESPSFAEYAAITQRLPLLDLKASLPDDATKVAFYVNLYNALTQHAVVSLGPPPKSPLIRLFFGLGVGYAVGGYRLSLNEIENGVLRGNKGVSILPKPFGRGDARRELCVTKVDPRIHFVLNCAAHSCPPVLFLTAENLERSLTIATVGFLRDGINLEVVGNRVMLSQIFNWYKGDFSDTGERGVLEFIATHGDQEQWEVKEVKRILSEEKGKLDVGWKTYDWSLNSS